MAAKDVKFSADARERTLIRTQRGDVFAIKDDLAAETARDADDGVDHGRDHARAALGLARVQTELRAVDRARGQARRLVEVAVDLPDRRRLDVGAVAVWGFVVVDRAPVTGRADRRPSPNTFRANALWPDHPSLTSYSWNVASRRCVR